VGKNAPSTPAAPDPVATANAQSAADKETAIAQAALNRINQVTPYGQMSYAQTGYDEKAGVPLYTQTTTFSPEQQQLYDLNQQFNVQSGGIANSQLDRLNEALSKPVSYEGAPELMSASDQATQDKAEQALLSRLNPQFERDRASLESRLASQGISMGNEAYNTQMEKFGQNVNDARTQAALQAIQLGQSNAQLNNQARQQYVQEASSIRNQPLNEISALISGTQVQSPQFSNVSSVSLPQSTLASNIYNSYAGNVNAANAQNSSNASAAGGLYGLAGNALGSAVGSNWFGKLLGF